MDPALPKNVRVVAVGDIHGMLSELRQLNERLIANENLTATKLNALQTVYVYLGDYVDRGPDSAGVIEYLLAFKNALSANDKIIFLRGNHEQLLLDFLEKQNDDTPFWLRSGGYEMLESYGVFMKRDPNASQISAARLEFRKKLPSQHLKLLQDTQLFYSVGDYFFCHATVDPNVSLEKQTEKDLLWSRDTKYLDDNFIGSYIVHGHTPVKKPILATGHINIDTGAYVSGELTALVLFGTEKYFGSNKVEFTKAV